MLCLEDERVRRASRASRRGGGLDIPDNTNVARKAIAYAIHRARSWSSHRKCEAKMTIDAHEY
jgi:hypothetical protein